MCAQPPASGLYYATDLDGARLPVIDITHPAFAIRQSEADLAELMSAHQDQEQRRARMPRWLQGLFYRLLVRRSYFGQRFSHAHGSYLDAMSTYRLKLGPDHLDPSWARPFDHKIAGSFPALCMRLRLQDIAGLIVDDVAPRLSAAADRALYFANIAGGPCMDSINALLLLRRQAPERLRSRAVRIAVFDQDPAGPAFATRALAALQAAGAPLHGIDVTLVHTSYRWDDPKPLAYELARWPRDIVAVVCSEGGLFDYGADQDIAANLAVAADLLPVDTAVTGSFSPPRPAGTPSPVGPRIAIRQRDLALLAAVARRADWEVTRVIPRPFQTTCLLRRTKTGE